MRRYDFGTHMAGVYISIWANSSSESTHRLTQLLNSVGSKEDKLVIVNVSPPNPEMTDVMRTGLEVETLNDKIDAMTAKTKSESDPGPAYNCLEIAFIAAYVSILLILLI